MSQLTQAVKDTGSNAAVSDPASTQRRRILLVEGDGFTRLVLLLRLRLAGFEWQSRAREGSHLPPRHFAGRIEAVRIVGISPDQGGEGGGRFR
jgi:hypothetical protein